MKPNFQPLAISKYHKNEVQRLEIKKIYEGRVQTTNEYKYDIWHIMRGSFFFLTKMTYSELPASKLPSKGHF